MSTSRPEQVCAVVVTFNRRDLLRECLHALLAQTHTLDRILVIDNASTDGTPELLAHEFPHTRFPQIEPVRLPVNSGGAGGFHEGFRRAFDTGDEWLWAMDDDGLPEPQALEHLLAAPPAAGDFRGALVLAGEDRGGGADGRNERLAFQAEADTPAGPVPLRTHADARVQARDGVIAGCIFPFNGVLIRHSVVARIGWPRKEFFLWGDEWDYVFRAHRLGITTATVVGARFWHPLDRTQRAQLRVGWMEFQVSHADTPLRSYLLIRNGAYLASRYRGVVAWLRHTLKYLLHHRASAQRPFTSWQVLRHSLEGLGGRLRGHARFLPPPPPPNPGR